MDISKHDMQASYYQSLDLIQYCHHLRQNRIQNFVNVLWFKKLTGIQSRKVKWWARNKVSISINSVLKSTRKIPSER